MPQKPKNKGGRPRVYSDEALAEYGNDLIKFVQSRDDVCHVSMWEMENDFYVGWCADMARTRAQAFSHLYKRAKAIIGNRILTIGMKGSVDRWIMSTLTPYYLRDIDGYLDEKLERKINLEKAAKNTEQTNINEQAKTIVGAVDELTKDDQPAQP